MQLSENTIEVSGGYISAGHSVGLSLLKFYAGLRKMHVLRNTACSGARNGRSGSSKVVDFGTNRQSKSSNGTPGMLVSNKVR